MRIPSEVRDQLALRFGVLFPHLDERQQRLALATEARLLGHGGVRAVARTAGVSETTVRKGVFELEGGEDPLPGWRVRRCGGGRKSAEELDPRLVPALLALVEPDERGDPISPLRWTTKSLRHLAEELAGQGHPVSAPTVGRLLRENGFSLQVNAKTLEGRQHPDRDAQFRYINEQVKQHQGAGEPVISVDAKKKEKLGQLPNAGREWRPKGEPVKVEDHSFFFCARPDAEQAIPYGVYDLTADTGWVNVGCDHDTAAFAVASIRRWWQARGRDDYPQATRLLITADAGGSNGYRSRVWKAELAALAAETGLKITVCHFPPGASKWNKIEHRLFSHITMNWRGRPLTSHEVVVQTIASTRTRTGLRVEAALDTGAYPTGVTVGTDRMKALPLEPHTERGTWNYTIRPADKPTVPAAPGKAPLLERAADLELLSDPRLTGMNHEELDAMARRLAPAQAARREELRHQQRGGKRRQVPGAHGRSLLSARDRLLITVLHLRQVCAQKVLAEILQVTPPAIGQAIRETRPVLDEHHYAITPTALHFTQAQEVLAFVRTGSATPPRRSDISTVLTDPSLTGMSREDLQKLTDRLLVRYTALRERRRYQRRGGPRQPGTNGGAFHQKILHAERILIAVLHQRTVCTRQVLADLFDVTPQTIGTIFRDLRPLLEEDGHLPTPATPFRTAADLLASVAPPENAPQKAESPR
ncbi:ISAzo13 family transposase (plasmid) [Streptomyces sp. NBC_00841]|uniref:ISAzo13 family transposase n=1 Tax=unclassified Streptomyces TaxID=2593676 RepID=UPI0022575CA7|nr:MULTISPECIES: ISAzo13 family transposase [unclassified Streptomyces]MCX4537756.1 ISAzo13 family transposase [Streptomyces sp. NBC_01669]WSA04883.1 ISAzo13 family transposase [Streptomyces sp. NBC_00841]WSA05063.1 ISAzo13 family transposase [Streptomyces sp. NBC_00841]WSA05555.1 ISAzo13 family transposase [Streptomyces sp. NBC_00841]